jgi:hypothetical protein
MSAIGVLMVAVLPWVAGIVWLVARGGRHVVLPAAGERLWSAGIWAPGR